MINTAATNDTL